MQRPSSGAYGKGLWRLPAILGVSTSRVRYQRPKLYYAGRQLAEAREGVELLVKTAGEFPARALSPVLYVGKQAIAEYERAGNNLYRFYAFDFANLQEGAPIAIGWSGLPGTIIRTKFRYSLRGNFLA